MHPRLAGARTRIPVFCGIVLLGLMISSAMVCVRLTGVSGQSQPVFGTPFDLSQSSANATNPDVWNVGNNVYVAWSQNGSSLDFRSSPDGGATWNPPLSSPPLNLALKGSTGAPLLSANGSNVYVVFPEGKNGTSQIVETTLGDYGQYITSHATLTSGNVSSITPVIASWGNNVYVAWSTGANSYISCSNDSGYPGTWTAPYEYGNQHEPEIAAWGGQYVYAVSDAGMVVSSNNCGTWQPQNLQPWGAEPWIWSYGQNVYAAWEAKGNQSVVYYSYSNNYGGNWTEPAALTSTLNNAWAPMVWAYNDSAWIAVHTYPGGPQSQVYMYTTSDSGLNWTTPIPLSSNPKLNSTTSFPFTVTSSDGQNVFVAWSQQINPNYFQLYASYSSDGGQTWTAQPGIDISQNPIGTQASNNNDLADAAIASFGSNCFAVYQYTNGSSNQIYFSSTEYSPPTTTSTTSSSSTSTSSSASSVSNSSSVTTIESIQGLSITSVTTTSSHMSSASPASTSSTSASSSSSSSNANSGGGGYVSSGLSLSTELEIMAVLGIGGGAAAAGLAVSGRRSRD